MEDFDEKLIENLINFKPKLPNLDDCQYYMKIKKLINTLNG